MWLSVPSLSQEAYEKLDESLLSEKDTPFGEVQDIGIFPPLGGKLVPTHFETISNAQKTIHNTQTPFCDTISTHTVY